MKYLKKINIIDDEMSDDEYKYFLETVCYIYIHSDNILCGIIHYDLMQTIINKNGFLYRSNMGYICNCDHYYRLYLQINKIKKGELIDIFNKYKKIVINKINDNIDNEYNKLLKIKNMGINFNNYKFDSLLNLINDIDFNEKNKKYYRIIFYKNTYEYKIEKLTLFDISDKILKYLNLYHINRFYHKFINSIYFTNNVNKDKLIKILHIYYNDNKKFNSEKTNKYLIQNKYNTINKLRKLIYKIEYSSIFSILKKYYNVKII